MERFLSPKIVLPIFIVMLGIPVSIYLLNQQQTLQQYAWSVQQSATSACSSGSAVIYAKFTNTETNTSANAMTVTAQDIQTNKSVDLGSIKGGETKTATILTGKTSLNSGIVVFSLKWTDGHAGTDTKNATYPAVSGCATTSPTPNPTTVSASTCPTGTEQLFTQTSNLAKGQTVGAGGKITAISGTWDMENRSGQLLAHTGAAGTITVTFPSEVLLDTVLIFDNDPKTGEKPWSINGKSLPTTSNDTWAPPYKLNLTASSMNFDTGGDSTHFNVCLKKPSTPTPTPTNKPSPTPTQKATPTPTKKLTPTPTQKITPTPSVKPSRTPTPTKTITPMPSMTEMPTPTVADTPIPTPTVPACIVPKPVTNVHVVCPYCSL